MGQAGKDDQTVGPALFLCLYLCRILVVYTVYLHGREQSMANGQVVKWGNSLAVRIPKSVAERARMNEGDTVVLKAAKGRIEVRNREKIPTLKELVAQITPENSHPEIDWGPDVGREKVEW